MNPVVSSGLKLSNESIDASDSEYSFSVLLERPRTYTAPLEQLNRTSPFTLFWLKIKEFSTKARSGLKS